jgi:hypothetical protein
MAAIFIDDCLEFSASPENQHASLIKNENIWVLSMKAKKYAIKLKVPFLVKTMYLYYKSNLLIMERRFF